MTLYRKKPAEFDAVQLDSNADFPPNRPEWVSKAIADGRLYWSGADYWTVGRHLAGANDWIIMDADGELTSCGPDVFRATYVSAETTVVIGRVEYDPDMTLRPVPTMVNDMGTDLPGDRAIAGARFDIGDQVEKHTGDYQLPGEIRGVFSTKAGKVLYAVEHMAGFIHIYSEANLRPVAVETPQGEEESPRKAPPKSKCDIVCYAEMGTFGPNGPAQGVARCRTHNMKLPLPYAEGDLCPFGRIEKEVEDAFARIARIQVDAAKESPT